MNAKSSGFRYLAITLINALFWHPVLVLAEGIAVSPGGGNTHLDQAGNGVPVIDIATPNGKGLSHNTFSDYNVDKRGLILNNATTKWQDTQLAGKIVGNPNLRDRAASLIVNEVNGGSPSRLAGYTEVAGARANVVVANPYGITCDGCGFINSPHVTLSTGKPIVENGELDHYAVEQGRVAVEGLGLDATQVDQFDIITRAAKLNADIHAHRLNIVTGANDVDAGDLSATPREGKGATPALALDASTLGGMYADRISLIGTEAGVGVRVAGDMAASAGDILIDAAGHLELSDTAAARRLDVRAASIDAGGQLRGERRLAIHATGDMALYSNVSSAGDISLEAGGKITQRGEVIAGVEESKRLEGRRLTVRADRIDNHGRLDATQQLKIDGRVASNHGQLLADEIAVTARDAIDNTATIQGQRVSLDTASLHNDRSDATIAAERDLDLRAPRIVNRGDLRFGSGQDVILDIDSLDNQKGRFLLDAGDLDLKAVELVNDDGVVHADGLSMAGQTLSNRNGGLIDASAGGAKLDFDRQIDNSSGQLQATGALHLTGGDVSNRSGKILADTLTLEGDSLDNRGGELLGRSADVSIKQSLDNTKGRLVATTETLTLDVGGDLGNSRGVLRGHDAYLEVGALTGNAEGLISADNGDLDLTTQGDLNSAAGRLQAQHDLTLVAGRGIDNSSGNIVADQVDITGAELRNLQGVVSAERRGLSVSLNKRLDNTKGHLQAISGDVGLDVGALSNQHGVVSARALNVSSRGDIDNGSGHLVAEQGALGLDSAGALGNVGGSIDAGDEALQVVTAGAVDNADGVLRGGAVNLEVGALAGNRGGLISADNGDLELVSPGTLDTAGGQIQAAGDLTLTSESNISTDAATLMAKRIDVRGHSLSNQKGTISAEAQALAIEVAAGLDNSGGQLQAARHLALTAGGDIRNQEGVIIAQGIDVEGHSLHNRKGAISAEQGALGIHLDGALDNSEGRMKALSGAIQLATGTLTNEHGDIAAASLAINTEDGIANAAGQMTATQGDLRLQAPGDIDNAGGRLVAEQGNTRIEAAGGIDNTQGVMLGQNVHLDMGELNGNAEGLISAEKGELGITAKGLLSNVGGQLQALNWLILNSDSDIVNDVGTMVADGIAVASRALSNRGGVVSAEKGSLTVTAEDEIDNTDGYLQAVAGDARFDAGSVVNDRGVFTAQAIGLSSGGDVTNVGGRITATDAELNLTASGNLDNTLGVLRGSGVRLEADALTANQEGLISADKDDLRLIAHGALGNGGGQLQALHGLTLKSDGGIDNDIGTMVADHIEATGRTLSNRKGVISTEQDELSVTVEDEIDNTDGHLQALAGDARLEAGSVINDRGVFSAQAIGLVSGGDVSNIGGNVVAGEGDLTMDIGGELNNRDGTLIGGVLTLESEALTSNRDGVIGAKDGSVTARLQGRLDNDGGRIQATRALSLDAASIGNRNGRVIADSVALTAAGLDNRDAGTVSADYGDATLRLSQRLDNDGGTLQAAGMLRYQGGDLNNRKGRIIAQALDLTADSLNNSEGLVSANAISASIHIAGVLDNVGGQIQALDELGIRTASLGNGGGTLVADKITIDSDTVVNEVGTISAEHGDLDLSVSGDLGNDGGMMQATEGTVTLSAGSFTNRQGDLFGKLVKVGVKHSLNNGGGRIAATEAELNISAGGGLDNTQGVLRGSGVRLEAEALRANHSGLISADEGDLRLFAHGALNNDGGQLQAMHELTLESGGNIGNDAGVMIADHVRAGGHALSNREGVIIAEQGDLTINADGDLDNTQGVISGNDVRLEVDALEANQGGLISAEAGDLKLFAHDVLNNGDGQLQARHGLTLESNGNIGNDAGIVIADRIQAGGRALSNRGGILNAEFGDLAIEMTDTLDNTRGSVSGQSLAIEALSLDNREGLLSADAGSATLTVEDAVNNVDGVIQAQEAASHSDRVQLQSASLDNRKGRVIAGEIEATVHGDLDNSEGVLLADKRFLNLSVAGELLNRRGGVQAKNGLQLTAATLNNDLGSLLASVLELHAEEDVSNVEGEVLATQGGLSLVAGADINNTGGKLVSNRHLTLIGKDFTNQEGLITTVSGNAEVVSKGKADNRGGTLQIAGALVLRATQAILNESGSLIAGALDLAGEELSNDGGIVSSEHGPLQISVQRRLSNVDGVIQTGKDSDEILGIDAGSIDNRSGRMIAGSLQLAGHDGLDNSQGELIADLGSIELKTGGNSDLLNVDGTIQAFSLLDIDAGNWNNTSGTAFGRHVEGNVQNLANLKSGLIVASDGPLVLKANGTVENVGGRMQTAAHLGVDVARLDNRDGVLLADTLQVAGEFLDNTQGVLSSIGDMTLLVSDVFDNTTGNINTRDGSLTIKGPSAFINTGGRLVSPHLDLNAADLDNRRGELISNEADITAVNLNNRKEGLISADAGDLSIAVEKLDNRNGQLQARGILSVSSTSLDNRSGALVANQVSINADTLDNGDGVVSAETGSLSLQVFGILNNVGGYLQALGSVVDLVTGTFDNSNGTLLADTIDLLAQGDVRNQGGRISARRGNLTLEAAGSVDNTGGAIHGDILGIRAASLTNSDNGLITADKGGVTLDLEGSLDNIGGAVQAQDDTHAASRREDIVQIQANNVDNRNGRVVAGEVDLVLGGDLENTQGVLLADRAIVAIDADGQLNNRDGAIEGKSVRISGNSFDNSGGYLGADEGLIDLLLEGSLVNEQGQIQAQDGLTMRAGDLNNDHGKLVAASLALFIDRVLSNHGGGILASDNSLLIDSQGSLDNTGGTLAATGKLELLSGSLINQQGVIASASGDAELTSQGNLDNGGGRLQAAGDLILDAGATVINTVGVMAADVVQVAGRAFNNTRGIVSAARGPLSLHFQKGVDNRDGTLQAGASDLGRLVLAAGSVDNRKGRMVGGVLDLGTQGQWDNRQGELIADRGKLNLDVANGEVLLNREGHIRAATGLKVIAGSWNNDAGLAVGASVNVGLRTLVNRESGLIGTTDGPLDLQIEQNVDNRGGQLQAVGPMSLETGQLDNTHGVLLSDTLRIHSDELNNTGGVLSSFGKLELRVPGTINNSSGRILSQNGSVDIRQPKRLINADGLVSAAHLELMMDDLDNRRGQLIGDSLELHGDKIDNSDDGLIAADGGGMLIDVANLDNSNGRLQADGRLDVQTGALNNTEGVLLADGVRLASNGLVNDQGAILGGKDGVTLTLDGLGDNRHGVIDAQGGTLQISSDDQTLDNRGGSLSGRKLTLSVDRLDNRANGQIAGRGIELGGLSLLDNRSGRIIADKGALMLGAATIDNRGGLIQGDSVNLQGDRLDNGEGGLLSSLQGLLKIVLGERLTNVTGRILANGMLDIDPPLVDNTDGQIAGDEITLTAGRLVNTRGIVEAQNQLRIDAGSIANGDGSLRSLGGERSALKVETTLDNRSGEIGIGSHDFQLEAGDLLNSLGTVLHAGKGLFTLLADSLNNRDGDLQGTASGSFDIDQLAGMGRWQFNDALALETEGSLELDSDERIASAGDLTLAAMGVDNDGELLANGDLALTSRGDLVNSGTISSQAALNIVAHNLSQKDGRLASGGDATYRLTGGLDNFGRLVAGGNIDLQASDINNGGTLGSQQDLRVVSQGGIDNNADTLLFSGGDMTLRGNRLTNVYGDIYSRGSFDFALDDQQNFADRLENRSGNIEAEGDIDLNVMDLSNKKKLV